MTHFQSLFFFTVSHPVNGNKEVSYVFIVNIASCSSTMFALFEEAVSLIILSIRVDFLMIKPVVFSQKEQGVIKVP